MNIAIIGSRNFNSESDYSIMKTNVNDIIERRKYKNITIVSGGARGADTLAERYAKEHNYKLIIKRADWDKYGKRAGYLRNVEMAKISDVCIAFIINKSPGSTMMVNICNEKGIRVFEVEVTNEF